MKYYNTFNENKKDDSYLIDKFKLFFNYFLESIFEDYDIEKSEFDFIEKDNTHGNLHAKIKIGDLSTLSEEDLSIEIYSQTLYDRLNLLNTIKRKLKEFDEKLDYFPYITFDEYENTSLYFSCSIEFLLEEAHDNFFNGLKSKKTINKYKL